MSIVALGLVPVLAGQEPDRERLDRLKTIAPALLGRAYLINENALQLIGMARQGATVRLSGEDSLVIVTAANADSMTAEYERRRVTYAAAIRARGFASVAGEYEIASPGCPGGSSPVLVPLAQQEFVVSVVGVVGGVVVERTLVTGGGDGSDGSYRSGTIGGSTIELRPFEGRGCGAVLTPFRRPEVRLEQPDSLIGSWEGLWDGEFGVRFTITPSDSGYMVLYEWQDYQGGPYKADTATFHPSSKRSIRGGSVEISIERDGEYGAHAVGQFVKKTRTARLKRRP